MARYFGYLRASTQDQVADGKTTLEDQERRVRGSAMARGGEIARVFSDPGVSGSVPLAKRPGGTALLAELRPGDIVIAAKLDRLFRSASDALTTVEALQKRGIGVILADIGTDPVTENGAAKLFFSMLAAFAEFERGRIAERMADGRRGKKRQGGFTGGAVPYGFRAEGVGRAAVLLPNTDEQRVIGLARDARSSGSTVREIARRLTEAGIVSRAGRPFDPTQVHRMIKERAA